MPTDRSADVPTDRSADVPTDRSADVPTDRSADVPTDRSADVPTDRSADVPMDRGTWDRSLRAWAGVVTVLALVARVVPVWRGGGLSATNGYDDGVYYAAATSLVHGRLPYRDYVLLHPPGSTVLLAPFALLARVTSDTAGFETARVAFMILGALNTLLVMVVAARIGRRAAMVAGVFYALFFPAIFVARTVSLEELGTTTLLVALVLLFRRGRGAAARRAGRGSRRRRARHGRHGQDLGGRSAGRRPGVAGDGRRAGRCGSVAGRCGRPPPS